MALLQDRVQETTTTAGTGTFALGGAVTGYVTFNSVFTNGNIVWYVCDDGAGNWEIGTGTLGTGTLTRSVFQSSNGGSLVNFAAGTKRLFCSVPYTYVLPDQTGNSGLLLTTNGNSPSWTSTLPSGITFTDVVASGGLYAKGSLAATYTDGIVADYATGNGRISVGTADTLTFYTGGVANTQMAQMTSTGINNTAIGATTPSTGAFTTLGATGAVTLNTTTNNQSYTTTGAGTITITSGTAGNINNMNIGATTAGTGAFTNLAYTGTLTGGTGVINIGSGQIYKDASGKVGIGTTSLTYNLEVSGNIRSTSTVNWNYSSLDLTRASTNTSTPRFLGCLLDGDAVNNTTIGGYPAIWGIYSGTPTTGSTSSGLSAKMGLASYAGFNFYNNGSQVATIDSSGNLGIGTSSPIGKFTVISPSVSTSPTATFQTNGANGYGVCVSLESTGNGDAPALSFKNYNSGSPAYYSIAGTASGALTFNSGGYGASAGTERMRIDSSGNVGIGTTSPAVKLAVSGTDAILIPVGTTGQRPTAATGYLRFNSTTTSFEGYNGTAWGTIGGATLSNDTTTSTNVYPIFASATSGTATTIYTSNANYLYKPSTGELQAQAVISANGITLNANTISASYTIAAANNGLSAGPVSVASGATVTVSTGSTWVIA